MLAYIYICLFDRASCPGSRARVSLPAVARAPWEGRGKNAFRNPLPPAGDARSRREGPISTSRRLRSVHGGNLMGLGRFLDVWACFLSDELHRSALTAMGAGPLLGRF